MGKEGAGGRVNELRFLNKFKEERGKRFGLICDR